MRLQLIGEALIAATIIAISATPARAEPDDPEATAGLRVYADDDHVTVVSPSAMVRAPVTSRTTVGADMTVDAVSAASVDVVTSASPRAVSEQRVELGLETVHRRTSGPTWFVLGVRGSHEHDYDALRLRLAIRRELARRNTMLELSYVRGADIARSVVDPDFRATRSSDELQLTASQLLGPRTLVEGIAEVAIADGYHASPYRQVLLDQVGMPLPLAVAEQTPRQRTSLAVASRLRRALGEHWFGAASYRFYVDDWSIASHTAMAEAYRQQGRWLVGASARGYVQDAAAFYRARYDASDGVPALRTRDRTLGAMRSAHLSLTADAAIDERSAWHVVAALGLLRWWFLDFPAQSDRDAVIVHASVTTSW